jgi:hypothetical protein
MPGLGCTLPKHPTVKAVQYTNFIDMPELSLSLSPPRFKPINPNDDHLPPQFDLSDFPNPGLPAPADLDGFNPAHALAKDIMQQFRSEIKLPGDDNQVLPPLPDIPTTLPPPAPLPQPKNQPQRLSKRRGAELVRPSEPKSAKTTGTYRIKIKDFGWFKLPHGYIPVRNTDLI